MKLMLFLSILLCAFTVPALGALTDADLDKIRLIVIESEKRVKADISKEIEPLKAEIVTLKTDVAVLKTEVATLKENVQKGFDRQNNIIIACIGLPLAILAIGATVWGISAHRRSRKDQRLEKQIETLTQEIETLTQEVETLKGRQIVRP